MAALEGRPAESPIMTVLVTGASGFIGRHLSMELQRRSIKVRAARRLGGTPSAVESVEGGAVSGSGTAVSDWTNAVAGCSAVIHLAARAHVLRETHEDPARAFHAANVECARACAEAAVRAGVQRFVFLSSVGVHGGVSSGHPIGLDSPIAPHTLYARSKADAELVLANTVRQSDMALTVIRPPLVYGPGAPGNFGVLLRAVARGWPLPLGAVTENRRSFVAIDNLVDLLITCLHHPAAANQTFLVSDNEDLSTADLLRRLGLAMGRPAHLLPIPLALLEFSAKLLGKEDTFQSLCGSLQVDISKTLQLLGWLPPVRVDEGLNRAVGGLRC